MTRATAMAAARAMAPTPAAPSHGDTAPPPPVGPLSEEQIGLALRHLWRPGWPAAREDCLRDPICGPLIRALAYRLRRGAWVAHRDMQAAQAKTASAPLPTLTFDSRRAAANDHDD